MNDYTPPSGLPDKVLSLSEAIETLVNDGDKVALGLSLESLIPFAAGHELIRQGKKELTLIGPISDILFDQMIGCGCAAKVMAAWVGNVATGQGYNFRRAVEQGELEMIDFSNQSLQTGLEAAAKGLPYGLTKSLLGSDILSGNPHLAPAICPFSGQKVVAVEAIRPDVAIIHAQRSDDQGNVVLWGPTGVALEAAAAADRTIVVCEELVSHEEILKDPGRCALPGFLTTAVVVEPWGAHPAGVQGFYGHDDAYYVDYALRSRSPKDFKEWRAEWIDQPRDRGDYLRNLGPARISELRLTSSHPTPAVDFGY